MSLIVPDTQEIEVLTDRLTPVLTIKLYGNDYTPVAGSTVAAFTEISGGGYASKSLTFANWTLTPGNPSQAVYNATQVWMFTDVIDPPGTIYGYFVIRNSDNALMWAERFPTGVLPFAPITGSQVKILLRYSAQSLF